MRIYGSTNRHESLPRFFARHGQPVRDMPFGVYRREEFGCDAVPLPSGRRDFYKISLVLKGTGQLIMADRTVDLSDNALVFSNPLVPYTWYPASPEQTGYFSLFTEDFVGPGLPGEGKLSDLLLFRIGGQPVYFLDEGTAQYLGSLFEAMLREAAASYAGKYDLLQHYVHILLHEALKLQPPRHVEPPDGATGRIARLFFALLEKQFPVDGPYRPIRLRRPRDYAAQLHLHTNSLNRALVAYSGRPTTVWITQRLVQEAKTLLLHSDWDIARIAYLLGFEHPSNFIAFFRRQTSLTPGQFRKLAVSGA